MMSIHVIRPNNFDVPFFPLILWSLFLRRFVDEFRVILISLSSSSISINFSIISPPPISNILFISLRLFALRILPD